MRTSAVFCVVSFVWLVGCNRTPEVVQAQTPVAADSDPSSGNLAPATGVASAPQEAQNYSVDYQPPPDSYPQGTYQPDSGYDSSDDAQVVYADAPPPPLPEYNQPPIPGDNYYWTPGYWAYDNDYYWVPGAWVMVPWVNALWTPPYWGYEGGRYRWHGGYWGPHVGFYGGVNYGFGYTGRGYYGAYWNQGSIYHNRAVTNVTNVSVRNVYNYSVPASRGDRVSYNGGRGGVNVRPTPQELAVSRDPRTPPVTAQVQQARDAGKNRAQFAGSGRTPAALVAARPLQTNYRAPAATPPAAAMRVQQNGQNEPGAGRPAPARTPPPDRNFARQGRGPDVPAAVAPDRAQHIQRPQQQAPLQAQPQAPAAAPRPTQDLRRGPQQQPARPDVRPIPQGTPQQPQPQMRQPQPVPAPHAPVQEPNRAPGNRPDFRQAAPQQQAAPRPAPETRQPASRGAQIPESRPAPPPQAAPRVAPEMRQQQHPAPEGRPAPPPQAKAPPPAPHPAPESHQGPPPSRDDRKDNEKK